MKAATASVDHNATADDHSSCHIQYPRKQTARRTFKNAQSHTQHGPPNTPPNTAASTRAPHTPHQARRSPSTMSPNNRPPNNPEMCRLLRCTPTELHTLKRTYRALQTQHVNGAPLLGQLPSAADPDGTLREDLWYEMGRENAVLGVLMRGERYAVGGGGRRALPANFERRLEVVREKIFRDLNAAVRRRKPGGRKRRSSTESVASLSSTPLGRPGKVPRVSSSGESSGSRYGRERPSAMQSISPPSQTRSPVMQSIEGGVGSDTIDANNAGHWSLNLNTISPSPEPVERPAAASSPSRRLDAEREGRPANRRPSTTLPGAVRQIHELEERVKMLEQQLQRQESEVEEKMGQRMQDMFVERDRRIEKLRWYLEGDA